MYKAPVQSTGKSTDLPGHVDVARHEEGEKKKPTFLPGCLLGLNNCPGFMSGLFSFPVKLLLLSWKTKAFPFPQFTALSTWGKINVMETLGDGNVFYPDAGGDYRGVYTLVKSHQPVHLKWCTLCAN